MLSKEVSPEPAENTPDQAQKTAGKRRRRRGWLIALSVVLVAIVVAVGAFVAWAKDTYPSDAGVVAEVQSDSRVVYEELDGMIRLAPAHTESTQGLVFLVGAKVEPEAYVGRLAQAAAAGVTVLIIEPPLNLALLELDSFDSLTASEPQIQHWAVGGHSMGGVKACSYAEDSKVTKLLLFASYCSTDKLAERQDLSVLSLQGSEDLVINQENLHNAAASMPENTDQELLQGVTHGQFGSYGDQPGDGQALISDAKAQQLISSKVLEFLVPGK
ncbi:alpha/beta hydrolase [Glutamicibacter sp. NPDC087344]|uniref:alpha/beta hydrolase n=1 Tax=Glutamicibacter sp. NPDC087344 TaxID=3363994 RepID=UPI00380E9AED